MIKFPEELNGTAKMMVVLSLIGFVGCIVWGVKLLYFVFNHVTITIN